MTQSEYNNGLERIMQENPREVLLPALQSGYTRANVVYMLAALNRLPAAEEVEYLPTKPTKPADDTLRALWAERTRLFGEMNRMSNKFHECTTDQDRAENSRGILRKWDEILAVKSKIRHYEEFGEVLKEDEQEKFPLPDDPIALMKKLASIRVQISQSEVKIREANALPNDHPDKQKRIQEGETKRAFLILYRGHAEQKIAGATIHE